MMPHEDPAGPLDGCPCCMARDNAPHRTQDTGEGGVECDYTCRECGTEWRTAWWESPLDRDAVARG